MTRDEIIRMARECDIIDFRDESDDPHVKQMVDFLESFANLVAAAEREACAKHFDGSDAMIYRSEVSSAIRARCTT